MIGIVLTTIAIGAIIIHQYNIKTTIDVDDPRIDKRLETKTEGEESYYKLHSHNLRNIYRSPESTELEKTITYDFRKTRVLDQRKEQNRKIKAIQSIKKLGEMYFNPKNIEIRSGSARELEDMYKGLSILLREYHMKRKND